MKSRMNMMFPPLKTNDGENQEDGNVIGEVIVHVTLRADGCHSSVAERRHYKPQKPVNYCAVVAMFKDLWSRFEENTLQGLEVYKS